jgi:hypothetical protein
MLGPKMYENMECRSFHNEEFHCLYRSANIARMIKSIRFRWTGHIARIEEARNVFKILTGKPTGNVPLGRPRLRWDVHITIHLEHIVVNRRDSIDSAQDRNYWRTHVNAA